MSKPRIGETIRLKGGKSGVVQAVMSSSDVLQTMDDVPAMLFGTRQIALLGPKWQERYFKVAVAVKPGEVEWFEWSDVEQKEG